MSVGATPPFPQGTHPPGPKYHETHPPGTDFQSWGCHLMEGDAWAHHHSQESGAPAPIPGIPHTRGQKTTQMMASPGVPGLMFI